MRTTKLLLGIVIIAIIGLVIFLFVHRGGDGITNEQYAANRLQPAATSQEVQNKLASCGSPQNGTTTKVVNESKVFISIPKDIYPNVNLAMNTNGASANWASSAEQYGHATEQTVKSNCWSYYFQFTGEGTVDLVSKSGVTGTPDYVLHFVVTRS